MLTRLLTVAALSAMVACGNVMDDTLDETQDGDETSVCGDGVCQEFESCQTCPEDCGGCAGATCGDDICHDSQSCSTCPRDCGLCPAGCGDGVCQEDETCSNCPDDCGVCAPVCGDGTCNGDETCSTCPGDCGDCPPVCGDGTCNGDETCSSCPADCGSCSQPAFCGDGTCNGSETCSTCPGDCGVCPPVCGDGTCNGSETCSTCPGDCGVCPPICGDGTCNGSETCSTCPGDCGVCPAVCGDGSCNGSETCSTCPEDCGVCPCGLTGECFDRPIALGEKFACAIRGNKRVACWGHGQWGALGTGSESNNSTPVEIASLSNVAQVTAGYKHACALRENSEVWCWGYNTFNQLGTGSTTGPDSCFNSVRCSKVPLKVAGLPGDIVQVEAGKFYTCALSASGRMYCWGSPQDGVLGNGVSTGQFASPTLSTSANGAGSIAMLAPGTRHNCVLLRSGTDRVRCWGFQGSGRVGNGSFNSEAVLVPQVVVQANVGFISSGEEQSCVVLTNGTVRCWGRNGTYGLGNNTTTDSATPTNVVNAASTQRVSVEIGDSLANVCTATSAGGAQCWGRNLSGECGNGTTTNCTSATNVSSMTSATHIATGTYHSCAFRSGGSIRCWGMRTDCQLGDGDCGPGTQSTPVQVSNFP